MMRSLTFSFCNIPHADKARINGRLHMAKHGQMKENDLAKLEIQAAGMQQLHDGEMIVYSRAQPCLEIYRSLRANHTATRDYEHDICPLQSSS